MIEIKSALAKLMATENITVQHVPNIPTAMFDVKNRALSLPIWNNISDDLYDMLVVHEVGHALDTPANGWVDSTKDIARKYFKDGNEAKEAEASVRQFLNVVEDARIDKRQKRRYPGSKRNYVAGLKELHDRDFFGLGGKDGNDLPFIDRANLYFKGRPEIKFKNDIERDFIRRMGDTEKFSEVVELTSEIYKYALDNKEDTKQQSLDIEIFLSEGEGEGKGEGEADGTEGEPTDAPSDKIDGKGKAKDEDKSGKGKDTSKISTNSRVGGDQPGVGKPISHTVLAAEKNSKSLVSKSTNYVYASIPGINEKNLSKVVHDFTVVIPQMKRTLISANAQYTRQSRASLIEWRASEKDAINFMVKEFEMRKSADTYSRISIAKTGVIDTNKLHSYEYNDDIFRRQATIPKGKNHGFFMVLDWSGSMSGNLLDTMKQLFSLVLFCKKVQIPFEVYLFKSGGVSSIFEKTNTVSLTFSPFTMRNILSSRMNSSMFNDALDCLWYAAIYGVASDGMGGTPLNQSIIISEPLIKAFQAKNRLQIVSAIILTDGGSDTPGLSYQNFYHSKQNEIILRDDKTKKTYSVDAGDKMTAALVSALKDRTGCTALGFYICPAMDVKTLPHVPTEMKNDPKVQAKWKRDNFIAVTSSGYDDYYLINPQVRKQVELSIMPTNNKNQVAQAFGDFLSRKAVSRTLLSRFINRVASDRFS